MEFEWHDAKAEANLRAHGVSFDLAKTVLKDPFALEFLDRQDYGEDRYVIVGMAEGQVLCSWPIPNETNAYALFQPGGPQEMSKSTTSNTTPRPMSPEAIEEAARADRDATAE